MRALTTITIFTAALAAMPLQAIGQTPEEEVLAVVADLFEGMRRNDGDLLRSLFHADALMTGTGMREGSYQVDMNPPDSWIESISSYTGPEIDERIYDPKVDVSGPLASVWTEYNLFVGGEFRHCGVDAFHLALTDEGWKIVHLADTRVTEGCPKR